eukprot:6583967-Pyramimonas_sp.AAC.1
MRINIQRTDCWAYGGIPRYEYDSTLPIKTSSNLLFSLCGGGLGHFSGQEPRHHHVRGSRLVIFSRVVL